VAARSVAEAEAFSSAGRQAGRSDIFSIRLRSASLTGMTESQEIRTSGKSLHEGSALISFSVTGRFSFFTGATSTTADLSLLSFGSP
jgi:hypothetical protein